MENLDSFLDITTCIFFLTLYYQDHVNKCLKGKVQFYYLAEVDFDTEETK